MKKLFLAGIVLLSFPSLCHAQELTPEAVAEIWPYAETILKVKASTKDRINVGAIHELPLRRQAKVVAQSEDGTCTAYESLFQLSDTGWAFDSTVKEYEVSCRSYRARGRKKESSPVTIEKTITD